MPGNPVGHRSGRDRPAGGRNHSARANTSGYARCHRPGIVLPRLREFEQLFPGIELTLVLSDRPVDLIYDGIDCVIRTGELTDSMLTARRLGQLNWLTCAAPRYLKEYGEPDSVEALRGHRAVNYIANATGRPL